MVDGLGMGPYAAIGGAAFAGMIRATPAALVPVREQVDKLIAEADRIKRVDYDRLRSLAEEAYELACQPDADGNQYRFGMASAVNLLAHLSSVQGESEPALQQASQALALLDSHEPSTLLGEIHLTTGWAHYQAGDYVDALSELKTARTIADRIGNRSLTAYVMDRTANVYGATDRAPLALDLHERALAIHRELGDTTGEAMVLNNMSYTLIELGRYEDALGTAFGALHFAESVERLYLLMGVLGTVADIYLAMGDLDKAADYSGQGLELAVLHRSEPDMGDALTTMAIVELQRKHFDQAHEAAERALALAVKHRRSIEEFQCHELLSRIQQERGDIPSAFAHYRRYHDLERVRINEETASRLAHLQVEHEVDTARKDAEIHRLRSLALQREVEQRRIAQTHLEAQASLDPLTGLFNRRHVSVLAEDVERELALGRPAAVILFDLDYFKDINDTYGHFTGDRALSTIARLLRDNARDSDTPVRYGGDEFLVLLGGTGTEKARVIAERLRLAIATQPIAHRGVMVPLTVSIGVASVDPNNPVSLPSLIERADTALYEAKRAGRNCIVVDVR